MLKKHNCDQQSEEWFELRRQYPLTASHAYAISTGKVGLETLCYTKLSEKYSSGEVKTFGTVDTDRGNDLEPDARSLYELETGNTVETIGFATDDKISKVGGASPDGLVGDDGLLEIKAFADLKHFKMIIDFKKNGKFEIETQYLWQMQQQMLFLNRKWVDFLPYNPNYSQSLLIQRVYADKEMQDKIREGLKIGEKIINDIENSLK